MTHTLADTDVPSVFTDGELNRIRQYYACDLPDRHVRLHSQSGCSTVNKRHLEFGTDGHDRPRPDL